MNIDPAVPSNGLTSDHPTSGMPNDGRPLGSGPTVATPCAARSQIQLAVIAPITAMSAPGTCGAMRFVTRIVSSTPTVTREGGPADVADVAQRRRELAEGSGEIVPGDRVAGRGVDAEHPADLTARHLDADTGQEADEDRARQEVGEESEPDDACQQQHGGGDEGEQSCQRNVLIRPRGRHAGEAGSHDRGRRRVSPDDEVPRRSEHCEDEHRQQDRVEPGDDRHAGDVGVAHHLGDGERGEREASEHLRRNPLPVEREQSLERSAAVECADCSDRESGVTPVRR